MNFKRLRKKLAEYGIEWDERKGKGSHGVFVGLSHVTHIRRVYTLPKKQQKEVNNIYLCPLRRAFELTPEHGVTDEEFFGE